MPRQTEMVTIQMEGRDKGKTFLITEMGAVQGERWATRALLAMGRSGIEVPDELRGAGMAVVAIYGFKTLMRVQYEDVKPLLDQMIACVMFVPDPRQPAFTRQLVITDDGNGDDIEEISTLLFLRSKVFELHTGFSLADAISRALSAEEETGSPPPIQTSPVQ